MVNVHLAAIKMNHRSSTKGVLNIYVDIWSLMSLDVDECSEESDDCDSNADCTNTDGSFTCVCKTGWTGDGTTCSGLIVISNQCTFLQATSL